MANIAVYCGASMPRSESLKYLAQDIGADIARLEHTLLFGGSSKGLMGLVAQGALSMHGHIIGLTVSELRGKEPPITGMDISECSTLPKRLAKFRNMADIHLVLPGGTGTLEEMCNTFNGMYFDHLGVNVEERTSPKPIYLVDDPCNLNRTLFTYLESLVDENLINERVFRVMQLKSWPIITSHIRATQNVAQA